MQSFPLTSGRKYHNYSRQSRVLDWPPILSTFAEVSIIHSRASSYQRRQWTSVVMVAAAVAPSQGVLSAVGFPTYVSGVCRVPGQGRGILYTNDYMPAERPSPNHLQTSLQPRSTSFQQGYSSDRPCGRLIIILATSHNPEPQSTRHPASQYQEFQSPSSPPATTCFREPSTLSNSEQQSAFIYRRFSSSSRYQIYQPNNGWTVQARDCAMGQGGSRCYWRCSCKCSCVSP